MKEGPCSYAYRKHLTFTSVVATPEDIDDSKVKPGWLLKTTHISVENRTTDYTRLVIGISDGSRFDELEEEDGPLADDIYWSRSLILVPEGWFVRARLTGNTSGDIINVHIQGIMKRVR